MTGRIGRIGRFFLSSVDEVSTEGGRSRLLLWPNFMKGVGGNPSEASEVPILYGFLDRTGIGRLLLPVLSAPRLRNM